MPASARATGPSGRPRRAAFIALLLAFAPAAGHAEASPSGPRPQAPATAPPPLPGARNPQPRAARRRAVPGARPDSASYINAASSTLLASGPAWSQVQDSPARHPAGSRRSGLKPTLRRKLPVCAPSLRYRCPPTPRRCRRQRDPRAARRTAALARRVVRIPDVAGPGVLAGGAQGDLVHVGLGEHDRARGLQPVDHHRLLAEIGQERARAGRGRRTIQVVEILDGDEDTLQRPRGQRLRPERSAPQPAPHRLAQPPAPNRPRQARSVLRSPAPAP